jgi:hypothetical protein
VVILQVVVMGEVMGEVMEVAVGMDSNVVEDREADMEVGEEVMAVMEDRNPPPASLALNAHHNFANPTTPRA